MRIKYKIVAKSVKLDVVEVVEIETSDTGDVDVIIKRMSNLWSGGNYDIYVDEKTSTRKDVTDQFSNPQTADGKGGKG